jgi:hypothetical protein
VTRVTLLSAPLRFALSISVGESPTILVRFAISLFALALLGMALSLSAADSQATPTPAAVTLR